MRIARQRAQIDSIANSEAEPTFDNTVVALDLAGELLTCVSNIFFNLNECETSEPMQELAQEIQPALTELSNDITLNEKLFARVKQLYDRRGELSLATDQATLLEKYYKMFTRNGANLSPADKESYRALTTELADLKLSFSKNALDATNGWSLLIPEEDSSRVEGMPGYVVEAMAEEARASGQKGWKVTLQAPSFRPFMTYCRDRELKHQVWEHYNSRAFGGEYDNSMAVKRIAELRMLIANLLGYKTYADYVLEERMAGNVEAVKGLLGQLLADTRAQAQKDFDTIKACAASDLHAGNPFVSSEFAPWDWAYYEERYRMERYNLSEELTKPYLRLENVQNGVFLLAEKLYGLTFAENRHIPVYHKDVKTYEVHDQSGKLMAILYLDFFPRQGKRSGAWMTSFRETYVDRQGREVRPLVSLCCNFTKPTASSPSLLTFDEYTTLLHEFGHALHGMLAEGRYPSLTGTSVYRDFVELPSQVMENWATEKEFLDLWAVHYQTGEKMPAELIDRIVAARNYMAPYQNVRQVSLGLNDMAWHTIVAPVAAAVEQFEWQAMAPATFFPQNPHTCMSTAFSHIFSGGYAAGYYGYKWAEVLDADAFSLFREKGIFNRETSGSFRRNVLAPGGSENPMTLYIRFRGHKPDIRPLLERMGIDAK
ncbi:dipeptidyl carboxypeptidase II [Bacteroidia bacterium]|nr:dipeptidyl carboxypeptidase II [Bacteroidia bacterium]